MSGPKRGQAELNQQRREALRLQREREERVRRARESQRHDELRMKAVLQAAQRAANLLQHAQDLVSSLRDDLVGQHAAVELAAWERGCENARREIDRAQETQASMRRQFDTATQAWKVNPEAYQGGHFDAVDVSGPTRQAEATLVEARRIVRIAEARQNAQRLHQELDRNRAEAEASLLQARIARDQLEALPHAALAPGMVGDLAQQLSNVEQLVTQGDFDAVAGGASQIRERYLAQIQEVQAALGSWQEDFDRARQAVEETREQATSLDQAFIGKWAAGALDGPLAELEILEQALATAHTPSLDRSALSSLVARTTAVQTALHAARTQADERRVEEMARKEVVKSLYEVLQSMSFDVGVQLKDEADPLSDVLIDATHASGQEMLFRVDRTRQFSMNLDDGVKGADCVADLGEIIEELREAGIELEVTDWGHADPERIQRRADDVGSEIDRVQTDMQQR